MAELEHLQDDSSNSIGALLAHIVAVERAYQCLTFEERRLLRNKPARGLVWSLLATGYGLMTGLVIQGIMGVHAFGPSSSPVLMLAFVGNATGMLGSVIAAALTLMGSRAAHVPAVAAARSAQM
jgi:hypothetical protein